MPDEDDVIPMAMCPHCEHLVPEQNLPLHEARCQGRKRPARPQPDLQDTSGPSNHTEDGGGGGQHDRGAPATVGGLRRNRESEEQQPFLPRARWESPRHPEQQQHGSATTATITTTIHSDNGGDESTNSGLVSPVAAAVPPAAAAREQEVIDLVEDDEEDNNGESWSCPRCTLDNHLSTGVCEACGYRRPESERPPDPVRREQLLSPGAGGGNSGGLIGGAALLGSVLGGTGAYLQGQSLSSGLLNGAMTGAVSGALLNELARGDPLRGTAVQQQQQAIFTSSSGGGPTVSSISIVHTPDGRVVTRTSNGRTTSTTTVGGRNNTSRNTNELNMLLSALLAQQTAQRNAGAGLAGANTDRMTYEQLLQMFGTGTENLGAGESQIRSLPSATIHDVDKLPVDSRQCAICLEDFKNGDVRKIMPCLHGFHADCVDKWLRTNGSCPICKNRLDR